MTFQDSQHGNTSSTTWFTVITSSLDFTFFSQNKGRAVMSGLVVLFFYGVYKVSGFFFRFYPLYMTDKTRFFDFLFNLTIFFDSFKFHDFIVQKIKDFSKKIRIKRYVRIARLFRANFY